MLAIAELARPFAPVAGASYQKRHDEAFRVADEQLRFWRAQGLGIADVLRELNGPAAGSRLYFNALNRDDLLCLIASRWLAVTA